MIPTFHGLVILVLGIWLMRKGSSLSLLCAMLVLGLFEASAAIILPVLNYSSIPPARMMLGFLLVAVFREVGGRSHLLGDAMAANLGLVVFCVYGLIGALLLPHIFAGQIDVVPMRPVGLRSLLDSFPLVFSPQNVTTGVYLIGTGLTAIAAYVAGRTAADVAPVVRTCCLIVWLHAGTGLLGVALSGTPWDSVVDFVRNGSYSQIRQSVGGFERINGFFAEPSAYARFGIVWVIFSTELWIRDIQPRRTGPAAALLTAVLLLSASSTAYVGLGAYGALLAVRIATFPSYLRADKLLYLAMFFLIGAIVVLAVVALSDGLARELGDILQRMTVEKADSESGRQRTFWAMQGLEAFKVSWGLGIGAGSFRSSSLATAIIGSMGVIGVVSIVIYCAGLFPIGRVRPAEKEERLRFDVSAAACWAAVAGLIPAVLIQGSPDPGMEFGALAGLALALRRPAMAPKQKGRPKDNSRIGVRNVGATVPAARPPAGWRRPSSGTWPTN